MKNKLQELKKAVFIGLKGLTLDKEEIRWLQAPLVGGVILFKRNYESKTQLEHLCQSIKAERPELLISVDHEGGRVQRFREEFTRIPPMRSLGELYDLDADKAIHEAEHLGELLAQELREVGVDFSYTPVCDLDYGVNSAIGDRAFHVDPQVVAELALALHRGLRNAGSLGVAKHFPGHGAVNIDTHLGVAVDERSMEELLAKDLVPFNALIKQEIEGIMPAHIIYPALDPENTAVSSARWIRYLRDELGFAGVVISDDLDMKGADHLGDVTAKVNACFNAGVNIILLCNNFEAIREYLA